MSGFYFSEQKDSEIRSTNGGSKAAQAATAAVRSGALDTDCVCSLTRRAARSVTQLYDVVLAPVGIKATQFILLRAISETGEVAQWQLSKDLSIAVETLTRRLATMRRAGWVELHSGTDRREHLYSATPLGRQQLENALPFWHRAQERLHEQLGDAAWKETQACLDRLAIAAEKSLTARVKNLPPAMDA